MRAKPRFLIKNPAFLTLGDFQPSRQGVQEDSDPDSKGMAASLFHVPQTCPAGADGQLFRFPVAVTDNGEHLACGDVRFRTPGGQPISRGSFAASEHDMAHANNTRTAFAAGQFGPETAWVRRWWPEFRHELPVMDHRCSQRDFATAIKFVREEGGMHFSPALQAHEETMVMLLRLVNAADARSARRFSHRDCIIGETEISRAESVVTPASRARP